MLLRDSRASKLPQLRERKRKDSASPYSTKQLIMMVKRIGQVATRRSPSKIKRMLGRLLDENVQARARAHAERQGVEPLRGEVRVTTTQLSSVVKEENPKSQAAKKKKLMMELMQTDEQNEIEGREMDERLMEMNNSAVEDEKRRLGAEPGQAQSMSYEEEMIMREQFATGGDVQPKANRTEEVQTNAKEKPKLAKRC